MIDDIRYMIVFAKIVELGSISGGAEALGLSTATTSLHLSKLEKNLGAALLYRNTRKLSLTSDGAHLLETAQAMLNMYEKGVIEFKQRTISTTNKLSITMPAVFIKSPFMGYIGNFIKAHPDICLNISCSDSRNDIIGDSIDVAFRIGELPDSSLKAKQIFTFPRKVVGCKGLLDIYPPVKHPKDLTTIPWIGLTMRPNFRTFTNVTGEQFDIKYVPNIRVDNVEAAYHLAKCRVGLAAPPEFLVSNDLEQGVIEEVLPEWRLDPLKLSAIWPSNIATSSIAYTLINSIYDQLSVD
ncbi:MAG: LysR family transcriptional regulator [Glaciimonas sp.]|nr:LysR family transcriptional regulator [Glaciimonas sp.]